jgi:hypothetical protein
VGNHLSGFMDADKMRRIILGSLLVALLAAGALILHLPAWEEPGDELVAERLDAELRAIATPGYLAEQVARALDEDRPEDAEGFIALGHELGHPLPGELLARHEAANSTAATAWRAARSGAQGFFTGEVEDAASLAGSTLSDFTLYGDLRDFGRQAGNYALGQEVDEFVLGLSMVGLGVTAATVGSGGAAMPVKMGVSAVKAAKRTGRLTAGMEGALRRAMATDLDMPGLRRQLSAMDWKSPGRAVDQAKAYAAGLDMGNLRGILGRFGTIMGRTSPAATLKIMRHVDTVEDLARAERVAARFGKATPAVFQTLGKGAFKAFAKVLVFAAAALWSLVTALLSAIAFVLSVLWSVVRLLRRGRMAAITAITAKERGNPAARTSRSLASLYPKTQVM